MTPDEGYIKYEIDWTPGPPPDAAAAIELDRWRRPLHEAGLIGQYPDLGIGYGNISKRCGRRGQFLITGTQTGHLAVTDERHYALVTRVDIEANTVSCSGPVRASSEAMTHAAIYALDDRVDAIVHVHSKPLWNRFLNVLPSTGAGVAFGTPDMARELARLFAAHDFEETGVAVMAGHDEGLISFGPSLDAAAKRMLSLVRPEEPARA